MSEIYLKRLISEDWKDFKKIRLEALKKHPEFFCPSRDENQFEKEDWLERIENMDSAAFGLYNEDEIIGITGIFRQGSQAHMVMSYIQEKYRGKGFSRKFYEERLKWAKKQEGLESVVIEHREDNIPSLHAHSKFGSQFVESHMRTWPDGKNILGEIYIIKL